GVRRSRGPAAGAARVLARRGGLSDVLLSVGAWAPGRRALGGAGGGAGIDRLRQPDHPVEPGAGRVEPGRHRPAGRRQAPGAPRPGLKAALTQARGASEGGPNPSLALRACVRPANVCEDNPVRRTLIQTVLPLVFCLVPLLAAVLVAVALPALAREYYL